VSLKERGKKKATTKTPSLVLSSFFLHIFTYLLIRKIWEGLCIGYVLNVLGNDYNWIVVISDFSWCVCIYVCVYVCVYIYIYIFMCGNTYIYTYVSFINFLSTSEWFIFISWLSFLPFNAKIIMS